MAKTKKLGKGLKALISEDIQFDDDGEFAGKKSGSESIVFELEINKIRPNTEQPRKNFQKKALEEMAVSIEEHGILQPLVVRQEGKGYTIIAGERRWRAANIAGIKTVPVIVRDLPPKDVMEIALIENVQRENLNAIGEAMAYQKLMDNYNLTQGEIGLRIGKSRTAVTNTMRLLRLPHKVRQDVLNDKISSGHARALLALETPDEMEEMAGEIIDHHLSVRETEKKVREKKKEIPEKIKKKRDPYLMDVEEKLKDQFHTKVHIREKGQKGSIQLDYYSMDDLNRLLELLKINGR